MRCLPLLSVRVCGKKQGLEDLLATGDIGTVVATLATFPRAMCVGVNPVEEWDCENLTCLRACTMKAEHLEWMPEILKRLEAAASR